MPSFLAKKSMNLMREVYALAKEPERPQYSSNLSNPSFKPSTGLSHHFNTQGQQQHPQQPQQQQQHQHKLPPPFDPNQQVQWQNAPTSTHQQSAFPSSPAQQGYLVPQHFQAVEQPLVNTWIPQQSSTPLDSTMYPPPSQYIPNSAATAPAQPSTVLHFPHDTDQQTRWRPVLPARSSFSTPPSQTSDALQVRPHMPARHSISHPSQQTHPYQQPHAQQWQSHPATNTMPTPEIPAPYYPQKNSTDVISAPASLPPSLTTGYFPLQSQTPTYSQPYRQPSPSHSLAQGYSQIQSQPPYPMTQDIPDQPPSPPYPTHSSTTTPFPPYPSHGSITPPPIHTLPVSPYPTGYPTPPIQNHHPAQAIPSLSISGPGPFIAELPAHIPPPPPQTTSRIPEGYVELPETTVTPKPNLPSHLDVSETPIFEMADTSIRIPSKTAITA